MLGPLAGDQDAQSELVAFCVVCKNEEMIIHNWQETEWADGMMNPVLHEPEPDPRLH